MSGVVSANPNPILGGFCPEVLFDTEPIFAAPDADFFEPYVDA